MSIYNELQTTATELLTEYGDTFVLTLAAGGKVRVKGVFIAKKQYTFDQTSVTPLLSTQRECFIQGKMTKPPVVGDTLTYQKVIYEIIDVETISPTNTVIVFKLLLEY